MILEAYLQHRHLDKTARSTDAVVQLLVSIDFISVCMFG